MPDVAAMIALGAASHAAALETARLEELMGAAEALALRGFGPRVSYSRKVFIPLTKLCRDACGYCTFAQPPRQGARAFLAIDEVVAIATAGAAAGCQEALFTLGDRPEHRYAQVRDELAQLGAASTIEYLAAAASAVIARTTLLPHLNPGVMSAAELARLKPLAVSMGLMLESTAVRLLRRGGAHWRSPDKHPQARLATLRAAGELGIPFTTGLLVGIGESRRERIESLLAIRELQQRHGHIQEVIIQNFRAKPGTRMAHTPDAPLAELLWTIAVARLLLGESMSIQAPPNLSPGELEPLIRAGINDWGGVSPVTCDHVNPEAPWPQLALLEHATERAGRILVERLALVPRFACEATRWAPAALHTSVLRRIDAAGYPRRDAWHAGAGDAPPAREVSLVRARTPVGGSSEVRAAIARVTRGQVLPERELAALFLAEGADLHALVRAADELRAHSVGDDVTYVVNRNINYTNVCVYACGFCAFAKGRSARSLRGPAYELDLQEIARRTQEAAAQGATEVCLQGGIHPRFTGQTYLDILASVKAAVPGIHVHAFSPLEVLHGATTLGVSLEEFLRELKQAGLATLPGTAAEILDDEIRALICPDKLTTAQWLEVMRTAHCVGLRSTATVMFGHVESPLHWARHLLRVRALQCEQDGFTEFVPLAFVHMESPLWRRGRARSGPTFRETLLMHAIARLALHPVLPRVQASWVKLGLDGALLCLEAGANDLGGTLMDESITRAAGGVNGQRQDAASLRRAIGAIGRRARQRTTLYGEVPVSAPAKLAPWSATDGGQKAYAAPASGAD